MIGVTEPRRVAAVSMSHRVAYEMGLSQRYVICSNMVESDNGEHPRTHALTLWCTGRYPTRSVTKEMQQVTT